MVTITTPLSDSGVDLVTKQHFRYYCAAYSNSDGLRGNTGQLRMVVDAEGCRAYDYTGAGDSSLDNKYWVKETAFAINGYENILKPPTMIKDVNYWMNTLLAEHNKKSVPKVCSIMTAIEASTLAQRKDSILSQDTFIKNHISSDDYLIVSVGGNDIALSPNAETQQAMEAVGWKSDVIDKAWQTWVKSR